MGYAVEGYCYSTMVEVANHLSAMPTIAGAIVTPPLSILEDATSSYVSIPLTAIVGGTYAPLPPMIYRPVACATVGPMPSTVFDPATLDPATISQAFGAGFVAVSFPLVFAIGVSAVLSFLKGDNHV